MISSCLHESVEGCGRAVLEVLEMCRVDREVGG